MEQNERCLYILFSRQNTKIGRFIRLFLRNSRYSHVAVSLDGKLYTMYSFSRTRHDSPFSGTFVREYPNHYFIGDRDLNVKLCRVGLTQEAYDEAMKKLAHCLTHKSRMLYNLFDALVLPFGRRVRMRDAYTCVDFAAYLLGIDAENANIGSLEARLEDCCVYEGSLRELIAMNGVTPPFDDDYYVRRGLAAAARDLFVLQKKLRRRMRNSAARVC